MKKLWDIMASVAGTVGIVVIGGILLAMAFSRELADAGDALRLRGPEDLE